MDLRLVNLAVFCIVVFVGLGIYLVYEINMYSFKNFQKNVLKRNFLLYLAQTDPEIETGTLNYVELDGLSSDYEDEEYVDPSCEDYAPPDAKYLYDDDDVTNHTSFCCENKYVHKFRSYGLYCYPCSPSTTNNEIEQEQFLLL